MKLTPQEILSQTFSSKFKGLDPDEVKNFLQQVAETLESEIQEKEELKAQHGKAARKPGQAGEKRGAAARHPDRRPEIFQRDQGQLAQAKPS